MTIKDVIQEMRDTAREIAAAGVPGWGNRCTAWAEALEAERAASDLLTQQHLAGREAEPPVVNESFTTQVERAEPVAWLHKERHDSDVITSAVKHVWGKPAIGNMAQYTIPLYTAPPGLQAEVERLREQRDRLRESLAHVVNVSQMVLEQRAPPESDNLDQWLEDAEAALAATGPA